MISADVKADVMQQDIKECAAVSYNFLKVVVSPFNKFKTDMHADMFASKQTCRSVCMQTDMSESVKNGTFVTKIFFSDEVLKICEK